MVGPRGGQQGTFPASSFQDAISFASGCSGKASTCSASSNGAFINSPTFGHPVPGIGTNGTVTRVDTLYFKSDAPCTLILTTDNGAGGSNESSIPCQGLMIMEFPEANALLGLSVQGTCTITYCASGLS